MPGPSLIAPVPPNDAAGYRRSDTHGFSRRRPLFWLALSFCAGIAVDGFGAPSLLSTAIVFAAASLAALVVTFSKRTEARAALSTQAFICGLFVAFAAGALLHATRARILPASHVARLTSAQPSFLSVSGTVIEVASARAENRQSWIVDVEALGPMHDSLNPATGRVRLSCLSSASVHEGDRIVFRARIEAPPDLTLPDSFNVAAWLRSRGIHRVGDVFPGSVEQRPADSWRVDLRLRRWSSSLSQRLTAQLSSWNMSGRESGSQAALLNALLFGRRERLDISDREAFATSGTAHLLAISGLQIQFLAGLVFLGAAFFRMSRRRSALLVLILSLSYCALAGGDAPVVCATAMIALYIAAILFYREPDMLNVLGAAALLILSFEPAELFSAGFQLSFLSVAALITVYPAFDDAWERWRQQDPLTTLMRVHAPESFPRWRDYVRKLVFVSLVAWLATAPIVAWHMGRFATLSLFVNVLMVPWSSLCMVLGLLALIAGFISATLGNLTAWLAFIAVAGMQWVTDLIARVPAASVDLPAPGWPLFLLYSAVLLWIWIERGRGATLKRLCVLFPACFVAINVGVFFRETPAVASVTFLDLKRGRAALIESPLSGAAMVDAGSKGQGWMLAQMLHRRGISRLTLLVITADSSDALDGAVDLLKQVPAERVVLPRASGVRPARRELETYLASQNIPYGSPDLKQPVQGSGGVRWEFCDDGPPAGTPVSAETAISVRVSLSGMRVLFLNVRSNNALQRLTENAPSDFFQAGILRALSGDTNRWPDQLAVLVRQSQCRAIVAGSSGDPEEMLGLDLAELSARMRIPLLSPFRLGTLRVQADTGLGAASRLQMFRNGTWSDVPKQVP